MTIEIPCRINDTVWFIRNYKSNKVPQKGIVSQMFFTDDMQLCIVVKHIGRGKWGGKVFPTLDAAERHIGGGKNEKRVNLNPPEVV